MSAASNAIGGPRVTQAALLGFLGVLAFSFSLPATRLAVADLDPWFVGIGRAVVAGALAGALLTIRRVPRPRREDLPGFALVSLGVVIGFPVFTSLALRELTSADATVIVGLLPAVTAMWAVARAGERPSPRFWLAAVAGLAAVLAFAATQGASGIDPAHLLVLAAVAVCGLGYAEGGALSRRYGGWQTICWALVLSIPLLLPVAVWRAAATGLTAGTDAWIGFAYVSLVSMFLGFFAWYRALALGGVAKIGQIQLAQPVFTLVWSAFLLGEKVTLLTALAALAVLASVVATQRERAAPVAPSLSPEATPPAAVPPRAPARP